MDDSRKAELQHWAQKVVKSGYDIDSTAEDFEDILEELAGDDYHYTDYDLGYMRGVAQRIMESMD